MSNSVFLNADCVNYVSDLSLTTRTHSLKSQAFFCVVCTSAQLQSSVKKRAREVAGRDEGREEGMCVAILARLFAVMLRRTEERAV